MTSTKGQWKKIKILHQPPKESLALTEKEKQMLKRMAEMSKRVATETDVEYGPMSDGFKTR